MQEHFVSHVSARAKARDTIIACVTLVIISCTSGSTSDGSWAGERTEEGEVLTVRTIQGQVWSGNARLEEEISIGSNEEGPYLFEMITDMRVYDLDGQFIRNIGGPGEGPGEFRIPSQVVIDERANRIGAGRTRISRATNPLSISWCRMIWE